MVGVPQANRWTGWRQSSLPGSRLDLAHCRRILGSHWGPPDLSNNGHSQVRERLHGLKTQAQHRWCLVQTKSLVHPWCRPTPDPKLLCAKQRLSAAHGPSVGFQSLQDLQGPCPLCGLPPLNPEGPTLSAVCLNCLPGVQPFPQGGAHPVGRLPGVQVNSPVLVQQ